MAIAKPSKSLPFLTAPACQSSGMVGAEAGFDPLYLSDFFDIKCLALLPPNACPLASPQHAPLYTQTCAVLKRQYPS